MNKYEVLDEIEILSSQKPEIAQCLKLRYRNSDPQCILSIDWFYYLISSELQIMVYKIHIIHNKQYSILCDLLALLSNFEVYLDLCTKQLLSEENKVREKLDDLSTKKLRTKNTVKTSEQLSLSKDLQKVVNDDLAGLREMREATSSTLDTIITDRANTFDVIVSLRFFGKRIQKTFPSNICCLNHGDYHTFICNNIQYTSELALMMQDCQKFLHQNVNSENEEKLKDELDFTHEFAKLNNGMSDTIRNMNRHCSTLQELFQLKTKLGRQLVKCVKFHWK